LYQWIDTNLELYSTAHGIATRDHQKIVFVKDKKHIPMADEIDLHIP
jgi:hypothetical protein